MEGALCGLDFPTNDNVLVGLGTADDAGVYKVTEDIALIQTVDFFTPIVDDPFDFGRIAAANSLSDVYAMGGQPKTAMNIVAYPIKTLGKEILREVLAGGAATLREAGAVLLGGHSVEDEEFKYGLSVTGFVHPQKIWANQGLREGDLLILTKAIGTGVINTAIKGGLASNAIISSAIQTMAQLNKNAAQVMMDFSISACTDITGFGLLGHIAEMIDGASEHILLDMSTIPILPEAYNFAAMGLVPIGSHNNRAYRQDMVAGLNDIDPVFRDILFDPQTSGGLLVGCKEEDAQKLLSRLRDVGIEDSAIIGQVQANKTEISQKIELI